MRVTIVLRSTAPRRTGECRCMGSARVPGLLAGSPEQEISYSMKNYSRPVQLLLCSAALLALTVSAQSQTPGSTTPAGSKPAAPAAKATQGPASAAGAADTSSAYFHYMVAHEYEEMATTLRTERVREPGDRRVQDGAERRSELEISEQPSGGAVLQDGTDSGGGGGGAGSDQAGSERSGRAPAAGGCVSALAGRQPAAGSIRRRC